MRPRLVRGLALSLSIAVGYTVLAIVHTYPLITHLDTHLPGDGLADNVSFVWNLWWMREALASASRDFFYCPLIVAPFGSSLILHTHTAVPAFIGATLLGSRPTVEAQNLLLIGSLVFN